MTQTNLQFADHICQRMIANGMVRSQAEFSETWLDQCPSYLSSSKARQRNVPDTAIQFLFERLELQTQNYKAQANHMMGTKLWCQAYENTLLIHIEVQNYLTWKTSEHEAAEFPPERLDALRQRVGQLAKAPPPAAALGPSPLAKIIRFASPRRSH